ncbi:uncharacterized protein LOC132882704 isoform X1 [Neoarius graeffei]|uniref:uncharacterized protein LOC132882704 isoform X1 n=1 Tax=Neoarius graeffei TaxID=443677 RepID=UPI00298D204F|nr:uncharacterized protein LOC132882704 isoform X1 [Neoarius graeffei]
MELSPLPVMLLLISLTPVPTARGNPKAVVSIKPDTHVYRGERGVTLRCDIQGGGDIEWTFSWYKNNNRLSTDADDKDSTMQEFSIRFVIDSDSGDYTCRGQRSDSQSSEISDAVPLIVSERPRPVLSVSRQSWLTEGDLVTLSCEIANSSANWTFKWNLVYPYREIKDSQGYIMTGDSYTLSPAALNHTGIYRCRAERGELFRTYDSDRQPLWITGESPPVSLIVNPSRTQHFTIDSVSLSCEDQSSSTGWTVRRYTHSEGVSFWDIFTSTSDCSWWGSFTRSTCKFSSLSRSYTGVYWCNSQSGENSNPVNITVHDGDVILDSPVYPVTEGHPLSLRCLYRYPNSSNRQADFYKDGSVLQTQTTGEMIIQKVSKSDEGFYHCKHPEKGESPKSWVSVRRPSRVEAPFSVLMLICSVVTASPYLLATIILLVKCYRARAQTDEDRVENAVREE